MQTVRQSFHDSAKAPITPIRWNARMSFDKKYVDEAAFFVLGQSTLNGTDVLAPNGDNPLQQWQKYIYKNYTDRVVDIEYTRQIDQPYSMSSAILDVTMNNTDGYFNPAIQSDLTLVATNQSVNPSYESNQNGETIVRQNLVLDPRLTAVTAGNWTAVGGPATEKYDDLVLYTWGNDISGALLTGKTAISQDGLYTVQVTLLNGYSVTKTFALQLAGNVVGQVAIEPNQSKVVTATVQMTSADSSLGVYAVDTLEGNSGYVGVSHPILESGPLAMPYFDGQNGLQSDDSDTRWYPNRSDFSWRWSGTANSSISLLVGQAPKFFGKESATKSVSWLSGDNAHHGTRFIRTMWLDSGTDGANSGLSAIDNFDTAPNQLISGLMTVRLSRAMNVRQCLYKPDGSWLQSLGYTEVEADTWTPIYMQGTPNIANVGVGIGLSTPSHYDYGDFIDLDEHYIIQGDYTGDYFDGDTENAVWNGTARESSSNLYHRDHQGSEIAQYVLPKRPIMVDAGYDSGIIPQFVGTTQGMPTVTDTEAQFTANDFLSELFDMKTTQTIAMSNVRTDEVIAEIFSQFGILASQYNLKRARNIIPFVFYDKDISVGNILRKLMQAEGGALWLDEAGILRFEPRLTVPESSVMTFDKSNIVDFKHSSISDIINVVRITSDIREVQQFQQVFSVDNSKTQGGQRWLLKANESKFYDITLDDPLLTVQVPTEGVKVSGSGYRFRNINATPATGIEVGLSSLKTNTYTLTFVNHNNFDVEMMELYVWGEPARVVDTIKYEALDRDSVDKYGELPLEITDNDFFGSYSNCDSFALTMLDQYKDYAGRVEMVVRGDYSLQLNDIIHIDYREYTADYQITSIRTPLKSGEYTQTIKARHHTTRNWFILDKSVLNGGNLLAP